MVTDMTDHAEDGGVVAELSGDRLAPLVVGRVIRRDGDDLGAQQAAGRVLLGDRKVHGLPHLDPERRRPRGQGPTHADPDVLSGELRRCSIHGIRRHEQQHGGQPSVWSAQVAAAGHSNLPKAE
jgi:hypothetical protein